MTKRIQYISTNSVIAPVGFDTAVLEGFAPGGGLYVPNRLPLFSNDELAALEGLSYTELCSHILREFIDPAIIPQDDLDRLIMESFAGFEHPDILPLVPVAGEDRMYILELFHGPTQSFKDVAMGFLVRTMDYLLAKRGEILNLVLATTGDTGPAAAHAAAGLPTINCWPLFPKGMISPEQEGQMTGIAADNIHPVGVTDCADGGDDLDRVVLRLFGDLKRKEKLKISSVNSINWCRVMVQAVNYFYAYFKCGKSTGAKTGEVFTFSVPSGAFGNLFAGYLAKSMGLPARFICSVNANQTLFRAFNEGTFFPSPLIQTYSSAIDIALPYNFWRFLYFASERDTNKISKWMKDLAKGKEVQLDDKTWQTIKDGFRSVSISDERTLEVIRERFHTKAPYLCDPHTAVALAGALEAGVAESPVVCLATAHPAKFPTVISQALGLGPDEQLPDAAYHHGVAKISEEDANISICSIETLEEFLVDDIAAQ